MRAEEEKGEVWRDMVKIGGFVGGNLRTACKALELEYFPDINWD